MLLRWKPGLPLALLLLLGLLSPCSPGLSGRPVPAKDVAVLEFSTQRPVHLLSPAFLSVTIDGNLATDPRFLTFLGSRSIGF
uniref:Heparanase n=1 Tax=Sus scrofa TaxID=9823 RepID=A0A8D0T7X5_PIG